MTAGHNTIQAIVSLNVSTGLLKANNTTFKLNANNNPTEE
jgi:hypothetical protein